MNISIHALREEGDEDALDFLFEVLGFLSTPSARRATSLTGASQVYLPLFLSTPSARRATRRYQAHTRLQGFLSTPSARRATQNILKSIAQKSMISIHALREEGDNTTLSQI